MCKRREILHIARKYERGDIERFQAFLTIAATDCRETNATVARDAEQNNVPVIVADCREECNCYFPALVQDESFIAGLVSKNGDHRGVRLLAVQIRQLLKEHQQQS